MPYDYAVEKFHKAVRSLAGSGSQQQRVYYALLAIDPLEPSDLPTSVRDLFEEIRAAFKIAKPINDEGQLRASIEVMSEQELHDHSMKIVDLNDWISGHNGP